MTEQETAGFDYRRYWCIVYKRRYLALAVCLVIISAATWGSFIMPKTYEVSSTVSIQHSIAMDPLSRSVGGPAVLDDMLRSIQDSVTSRKIVEKVIGKLHLDAEAKADPQKYENLVKSLRKTMQVTLKTTPDRVPTHFVVKLQGSDPRRISDIVNTLVEEYIAENASYRRTDASDAYAFIQNQIVANKRKLEETDRAIKAQQGSAGGRSGVARQRDVALRGQMAGDLQTRLNALNNQLASLRTRYTDQHPEIIKTKDEIDDIKSQLAAARKALPADPGDAAQAHGASQSRDEMTKLQRERAVYQKIYEDLLVRLDNARVSKDLELVNKKTSLSVADPAIPPLLPVKPDPVLIILAGIVLGIAGGIGAAIGIELFDRSFKDEETIEQRLGISVLATIPKIVLAADEGAIKSRDKKILVATAAYMAVILLVFAREVLSKFMGIHILKF